MKGKSFFLNIKMQLKEHKSILVILIVYFLFFLCSGIHFIFVYKLRNALMSFLFLLFIPLLFIIEYLFNIEFPPLFILTSLFVACGGILGACFDVYHLIPFFDEILHGISGFIFSCLGYAFIKFLFIKKENNKAFFGAIIMGAMFSLALGLLWELLEYSINVLFGFDMLADTYINDFNSYLLSGTHDKYVAISNISKTLIYYGDNEILELNGYLDIGLVDTMNDMLICFFGSLLFIVVTILSKLKFKKINELLLPKVY